MPSLAKRVARNGFVDTRMIGEAVYDLKRNPLLWAGRGNSEEVLQELSIYGTFWFVSGDLLLGNKVAKQKNLRL